MLRRFPVLIAVAWLAASCAHAPTPAQQRKAVDVGGFEIEKLDGTKVRLAGEAAGRPTLVALWATWCGNCAREFAALGKLAPRAANLGGWVVAVSVGESRKTVVDFAHDRGLNYPILVDERFQITDALGIRDIPTTLVLDRHGRIVFVGDEVGRPAIEALSAAISAK